MFENSFLFCKLLIFAHKVNCFIMKTMTVDQDNANLYGSSEQNTGSTSKKNHSSDKLLIEENGTDAIIMTPLTKKKLKINKGIGMTKDNNTKNLYKYSSTIGSKESLHLYSKKRKNGLISIPTALHQRQIGFSTDNPTLNENNFLRSLQSARAPIFITDAVFEAVTHTILQKSNTGKTTKPCKQDRQQQQGRKRSKNVTQPILTQKWSRLTEYNNSKNVSMKQLCFDFISSYIFVEDRSSEEDCTRMLFLEPQPPLKTNGPFSTRFQFLLQNNGDNEDDTPKNGKKTNCLSKFRKKHEWNDYGYTANTGFNCEKMSKVTQKSAFFTLTNNKLTMYDLSTGQLWDELDLNFSTNSNYSSLLKKVDQQGGNQLEDRGRRIYVVGNGPNSKNVGLEVLILDTIPKLRLSYRLLFPNSRGAFGFGYDVITIVEDFILCSNSINSVQVFSLLHVILGNLDNIDDDNSDNDDTDDDVDVENDATDKNMKNKEKQEIKKKTLSLSRKPEPLTFRSKDGYLLNVGGVGRKTICIKNIQNDCYEVRCLDLNQGQELIGTIPTKTEEGFNVTLSNYDGNKPRLLVTGMEHGFEIIHINTESRSLKKLFSTQDFTRDFEDSSNSTSKRMKRLKRRSTTSNCVNVKNYANMETTSSFGVAFNHSQDLLAVVSVADGGMMRVIIYDNLTLTPFLKLCPVRLTRFKVKKVKAKYGKSRQNCDDDDADTEVGLGCGDVRVQFEKTYLAIRLTLYDPSKFYGNGNYYWNELYTVNLVGENVSEMDA